MSPTDLAIALNDAAESLINAMDQVEAALEELEEHIDEKRHYEKRYAYIMERVRPIRDHCDRAVAGDLELLALDLDKLLGD